MTRGKRLAPPEEDELSTLIGSRVRVHARGQIDVIKEEEEEGDSVKTKPKKSKKSKASASA